MQHCKEMITQAVGKDHKTEWKQDGGQQLRSTRSTERMEDDPGVEYRNRRDTGCDSGGEEELSDQDPSIYCRWKCQSLAGWGGS